MTSIHDECVKSGAGIIFIEEAGPSILAMLRIADLSGRTGNDFLTKMNGMLCSLSELSPLHFTQRSKKAEAFLITGIDT